MERAREEWGYDIKFQILGIPQVLISLAHLAWQLAAGHSVDLHD